MNRKQEIELLENEKKILNKENLIIILEIIVIIYKRSLKKNFILFYKYF